MHTNAGVKRIQVAGDSHPATVLLGDVAGVESRDADDLRTNGALGIVPHLTGAVLTSRLRARMLEPDCLGCNPTPPLSSRAILDQWLPWAGDAYSVAGRATESAHTKLIEIRLHTLRWGRVCCS